jgi:hypothetical protein
MDARSRVRQFLASGTADRPPFLAMATAYTARLAQCTAGELLADPGLFARSFTESVAVLGLEAVLVEIPAAHVLAVAAGDDPAAGGLAVLREDLYRLRATLRDRVAIVALLPGPVTLAGSLPGASAPEALDDLVAGLIRAQEFLGPAELDALACWSGPASPTRTCRAWPTPRRPSGTWPGTTRYRPCWWRGRPRHGWRPPDRPRQRPGRASPRPSCSPAEPWPPASPRQSASPSQLASPS